MLLALLCWLRAEMLGQNAIIKVEAFPYTRYGYLVGKVKNINLDAIEDQKLGLVFNVIENESQFLVFYCI